MKEGRGGWREGRREEVVTVARMVRRNGLIFKTGKSKSCNAFFTYLPLLLTFVTIILIFVK
jgi:hypothetical protein